MSRTIEDVRWFCSGHGNVAVVKVTVHHGNMGSKSLDETIYYIGQCEGSDSEVDSRHVADWGSRFPVAAGDILFEEY